MRPALLIIFMLCLIAAPALGQADDFLEELPDIEEGAPYPAAPAPSAPQPTAPSETPGWLEPVYTPKEEAPAPAIEEYAPMPAPEAEEEVEEAAALPMLVKPLETAAWLGVGFSGGCLSIDSEWSRDLSKDTGVDLNFGWGLGDFYTVTKLCAALRRPMGDSKGLEERMPFFKNIPTEFYGAVRLTYANYSTNVADLFIINNVRSGGLYGIGGVLAARYETVKIETGFDTALGFFFTFNNRFILL